MTDSTTPVAGAGITNGTEITAGNGMACSALITGHVACWGGNTYGELGDGSTTNSDVPVAVTGIP